MGGVPAQKPIPGKGVRLLSDGNRFFPDFIMWLQNEDAQHIVFLEPHGMVREGSHSKTIASSSTRD